jgi:two-component system, sensor histidine kinase PdtaS
MLQRTAWQQEVRYTIGEAYLTSKQCIALSLILNELVTNALKHGQKRAEVRFHTQEQQAYLEVSDDGKGFPEDFSPRLAANMGLELVESLIRTDLKGKSHYENRTEGGGRVWVTFPLPAVEE